MELETEIKEFLDKFPFLSLCRYGQNEYIGIVQNIGNNIASVYVYNKLKEKEDKKLFLDLGEEWWWESNRMIPINIFLKTEMQPFTYCMMTMNTKDVKISVGPCVNLNNLSNKRIKRKSVQVLRKR